MTGRQVRALLGAMIWGLTLFWAWDHGDAPFTSASGNAKGVMLLFCSVIVAGVCLWGLLSDLGKGGEEQQSLTREFRPGNQVQPPDLGPVRNPFSNRGWPE